MPLTTVVNVVEIRPADGNEVEQHQHQDDPAEYDRFSYRTDHNTALREPVDRRAMGGQAVCAIGTADHGPSTKTAA